jgi:hypothetical protein
VVEVIGLAQKAGLNRIGFVADPAKADTRQTMVPWGAGAAPRSA